MNVPLRDRIPESRRRAVAMAVVAALVLVPALVWAAARLVGGSGTGGEGAGARPDLPSEITLPRMDPPELLAAGRLAAPRGLQAAGEVTVWRQPDGKVVVRLDDLSVPQGRGAAVFLVPRGGATRPDGGVALGTLPVDTGSVNLVLPAGAEAPPTSTLVVWSETRRALLASATTAAP